MAKDIQCDSCEKNATVHLTQIIHGKVHKVDLCEACAKKLGVADPAGFSVADLISKNLLEPDDSAGDGLCESCGFTQMQFKKTGRLGCADCYYAFRELLRPILKNMHRQDIHVGKVPHQALRRRKYFDSLAKLEGQLRNLVSAENYERAAEVRDQIKSLKRDAESPDFAQDRFPG